MSGPILVLVDVAHEDCASSLLRYASNAYSGDEIHVAHVLPFGFYSYVEPYISKESQDAAAKQAKDMLATMIDGSGLGKDTVGHVLRGGIGEQALLLAKKIGASVIALNATRGDSEHTTLGTHAAQVSRHAPCTVHLVRHSNAA